MAKKKTKKNSEPGLVAPEVKNDWEHEDNARTLMRAAEILNDKVKMKGVKGHLKKQKKAFTSLDDIVKYRNDKFGPKGLAESEEMEEDNE